MCCIYRSINTIVFKQKVESNEVRVNNGQPIKGHVGGRTYKNYPNLNGQQLPVNNQYLEYDIHPYIKGVNRGSERIVLGSDGTNWFTAEHYDNFIKFNLE